MANRIQIRRGSGAPSGSLNYELGWDTTNKILYINDGGTDKAAALPLTGGVLTGHLYIAEESPILYLKSTNMDTTSTNNTSAYNNIYFTDKYNNINAFLYGYVTGSSSYLYIGARHKNLSDNDNVQNYFRIGISANDTAEVYFNNPAAWRAGLSTPYMVTELYPALLPTDGSNGWIKIGTSNTDYGLLPSQSGSAGGGHNYLGTSTWYWKYGYIDEIYGHLNGNADTATSATKDGSGNTITSTYAKLASHNNLIASSNEFTFASSGFSGQILINHRTASGTLNGNITGYFFGDGKGGSLANITSGQFSGNAATATTATTAKGLWLGGIGESSTTHATALQNYFNSYKDSIPRNQLLAFSDSTGGNGSITFGYFITGYDSNPYGGFFSAHYNTPYYIGIQNGTYTQWALIRDSGSTARRIFVTTSASVPSGAGNGDIVLVKV